MAQLIEVELAAVDRQANLLAETNLKLMDALNLYHTAMRDASNVIHSSPMVSTRRLAVINLQVASDEDSVHVFSLKAHYPMSSQNLPVSNIVPTGFVNPPNVNGQQMMFMQQTNIAPPFRPN